MRLWWSQPDKYYWSLRCEDILGMELGFDVEGTMWTPALWLFLVERFAQRKSSCTALILHSLNRQADIIDGLSSLEM